MSKINILDSAVFNRIAAGEVVERPRSIVKELVENSIDAGADTIIVEIKRGGIDMIRVVDNGCGMDAEDLEKAFLPHATSKIKTLENLNAITTLGFRGEALTSIASVAKVTLISKTPESSIGNYIIIENGQILERGERGCSNGTTVIVEDLFKNIPARAKFLSSPTVEESVISDAMSRLIMANHTKAIHYIANGKTVYQSPGNGLKNAIYSVYGKSFVENMVPIESIMPDITLSGFICKPYFTKPNRTYQTLIVNGRYVVNADVSFCIFNCYKDFLMKRQYPSYVLFLEIPNDMVDVNVHPSKLEIKFADTDGVKRTVYKTVKTAVTEMIAVPKEIVVSDEDDRRTNTDATVTSYNVSELEEEATTDKEAGSIASRLGTFFTLTPVDAPITPNAARLHSPIPGYSSDTNPSFGSSTGEEASILPQADTIQTDTSQADTQQTDTQLSFDDQLTSSTDTRLIAENYSLKTVLFDTYIVIEQDDYLLLIDQHAAHERLIYNKLVAQYESKQVPSQEMLIPHVFTVTPIESNLLSARLSEINACGFTLTPLSGTSYSLSSIPLVCSKMRIDSFVSMIIDGLDSVRYKKCDFVKDILMQSACKAAVKGEEKLSENEIDYLIKQFALGNTELTCPHGRPLVIKISRSEIEKWFKRVV